MSTATDLQDSEMEITLADTSTGITGERAVVSVKEDEINRRTGVNELPFDPIAECVLEDRDACAKQNAGSVDSSPDKQNDATDNEPRGFSC